MTAKRLQLILVVTLALSISILALHSTTYAQTTPTTSGLGQDVVRVLEGNWQTLPPGTQHWYRFDYAGGNLPIRISMDVNSASSAGFQVWTAAQFSQLATNTSATPVASSAPDPDDPTHIVWEGTLTDPGIYYIVVQPTAGTDAEYLVNIGGRGLAPATDGGAIVAGALNVNLRAGPSTAYSVIRTISQGTQLTVLGQNASNAWLSVRLADGTEGWIARSLTDFTGTAITVTAPALSQPSLAPPSTTATSAAVVAGAANVNLRSGPSTLYPVIRTLTQGTQFTVLGQDASGTWLSVRFSDGTEGWIARFLTSFVDTAVTVATPPLPQPLLAAPPTVSGSVPITSGTAGAGLYSGPSLLYSIIRNIPVGTQLTVLAQDPTGAWLGVRLADGSEGWVSRPLIDFAGTVPIVGTTPPAQPQLAPPATVAQVPATASLPSQAAPVDNFPVVESLANNPRVLRAGQIQWLTFSHPGDDEPVQIWMDSEPSGAVEFRIYREEDAKAIMAGANPEDIVDIGRGTHNENEPSDLFWRGAFSDQGRFYVMVRNGSTSDVNYSIYGVGPSIGG